MSSVAGPGAAPQWRVTGLQARNIPSFLREVETGDLGSYSAGFATT